MEVSGQCHAPAAFYLREVLPVPTVQEAGWASEPVWTQRLEENPLPGIELRSPGRPVCALSKNKKKCYSMLKLHLFTCIVF
jgi:hypothetical protein